MTNIIFRRATELVNSFAGQPVRVTISTLCQKVIDSPTDPVPTIALWMSLTTNLLRYAEGSGGETAYKSVQDFMHAFVIEEKKMRMQAYRVSKLIS
jgi:hypothetical protein